MTAEVISSSAGCSWLWSRTADRRRGPVETDDPSFAGSMQVITLIEPAKGGAGVIRCENVPAGITAVDHEARIRSTLANLAAYVEQPASGQGGGRA